MTLGSIELTLTMLIRFPFVFAAPFKLTGIRLQQVIVDYLLGDSRTIAERAFSQKSFKVSENVSFSASPAPQNVA